MKYKYHKRALIYYTLKHFLRLTVCSTPKPKRRNKGKSGSNSGSILSSMNCHTRTKFAERANMASDLRVGRAKQRRLKTTKIRLIVHQNMSNTQNKKANNPKTNLSWFYWLLPHSLIKSLSERIKNCAASLTVNQWVVN